MQTMNLHSQSPRYAVALLAFLFAAVGPSPAQTWLPTSGTTNWGTPANWSPPTVPNAVGATATFSTPLTANAVVNVDDAFTVGNLNFNQNASFNLEFSRANTNAPARLILDDIDIEAQVNIITPNAFQRLFVPMELNDHLTIIDTATGTVSANRERGFRNVVWSAAPRTITFVNNSTVTSSSAARTTLWLGMGTERLPQGSVIALRGTAAGTNLSTSFGLTGFYDKNVTFDFDSTATLRPAHAELRGEFRFGTNATTTLGSGTNTITRPIAWIQHDQNNGGNVNLRLAGPLTGGSPDHLLLFGGGGNWGQVYLDNPLPTSTYRGTVGLRGGTASTMALWISRDDQLGDPANPIQFNSDGGPVNSFTSVGGLSIADNVTTAREIQVGSTFTNHGGAVVLHVPEGLTLTLNGPAGQVTRVPTGSSVGNSFVKHGMGTLKLTGNASFSSAADYFTGNNNAISGTLLLDNTSVNVTNRLYAVATVGRLYLNDATLMFQGGSAPQRELYNRTVRVHTGSSDILAGNGAGSSSIITLGTLERIASQTAARYGTLRFGALPGADPIGSANNRIHLNNLPLSFNNGIIGPWATIGNDYATLEDPFTLPGSVTNFAGYVPLASATATDNAVLTSTTTLASPTDVNTLKLDGTGLTLKLGGNALSTDGLLNTGSNTVSGGTLNSLSASDLIVTDNGALTLAANLGSAVFVKTGTGTTTLAGNNNQTATIINEGTLVVTADAQLGTPMAYGNPASGYVAIAGGRLLFGNSFTNNRAIVLGAVSTDTSQLAAGGHGFSRAELHVPAGVTAGLAGKLTGGNGSGGVAFYKTGAGTLLLANPYTAAVSGGYGLVNSSSSTNGNDFQGNIVLAEGTLRVTSMAQLGVGFVGGGNADVNDIVFRGGTLELLNPTGDINIGTFANYRSFYVQQGGGAFRVANMTASRTLNFGGPEALRYQGANPGPFHIQEDVASNGTNVLNVVYGLLSVAGQGGNSALTFRATGTNSNYRGTTVIQNGTLLVAADAPAGAPGALGNATSTVQVGINFSSSQAAGAHVGLLIDTPGVTIGRNLNIPNNNIESLGSRTFIGGSHTSGTSYYTGSINLARSLILIAAAGGTVDFTGAFTESSAGQALIKEGAGTVRLFGASTYSGPTTVREGKLLVANTSGSATGSGDVTVKAGATFGGTGSIAGAATFESGARAEFTVTPVFNVDSNSTFLTINGTMTFDGTEVHLNLPTNLGAGTYTLAVSTVPAVVSGTLTLVVDSGSFDPNVTSASVGLDSSGQKLVLTAVGAGGPPTPPIITGASRIGGNFVVTFTGPSGQTYQVLTSTNVVLPLTNWTPVSSGTFSGSPVTFTNSAPVEPQRFYRIASP